MKHLEGISSSIGPTHRSVNTGEKLSMGVCASAIAVESVQPIEFYVYPWEPVSVTSNSSYVEIISLLFVLF